MDGLRALFARVELREKLRAGVHRAGRAVRKADAERQTVHIKLPLGVFHRLGRLFGDIDRAQRRLQIAAELRIGVRAGQDDPVVFKIKAGVAALHARLRVGQRGVGALILRALGKIAVRLGVQTGRGVQIRAALRTCAGVVAVFGGVGAVFQTIDGAAGVIAVGDGRRAAGDAEPRAGGIGAAGDGAVARARDAAAENVRGFGRAEGDVGVSGSDRAAVAAALQPHGAPDVQGTARCDRIARAAHDAARKRRPDAHGAVARLGAGGDRAGVFAVGERQAFAAVGRCPPADDAARLREQVKLRDRTADPLAVDRGGDGRGVDAVGRDAERAHADDAARAEGNVVGAGLVERGGDRAGIFAAGDAALFAIAHNAAHLRDGAGGADDAAVCAPGDRAVISGGNAADAHDAGAAVLDAERAVNMAALNDAGRVIHGGDGGEIDCDVLGEVVIVGAQCHAQIVDAPAVHGKERKARAAVSRNGDLA